LALSILNFFYFRPALIGALDRSGEMGEDVFPVNVFLYSLFLSFGFVL